jgi:hypothetical protein
MREMTERELDSSITEALEQKPAAMIPAGFAARVAVAAVSTPVAAPGLGQRLVQRVSVAQAMALVGLVAMVVAMFVVAPGASANVASWRFGVEMLLLIQIAAVAYGLVAVKSLR